MARKIDTRPMVRHRECCPFHGAPYAGVAGVVLMYPTRTGEVATPVHLCRLCVEELAEAVAEVAPPAYVPPTDTNDTAADDLRAVVKRLGMTAIDGPNIKHWRSW